jgi:hypothetical protein
LLFHLFDERHAVQDILALIFRFTNSWLLGFRRDLFGRFLTGLL